MKRHACVAGFLAAAAMIGLTSAAQAADLEEDLERAWIGAWVITAVETYSDCTGFFTNNEVHDTRVSSKGDRRFAAGELARVDKVNVKRTRIDLFIVIAAPVLRPRQDGPFTLFDERECKVQLLIDAPREVVKEDNFAATDTLLLGVVTRFSNRAEAEESTAWNGREPEGYPDDYEMTLARHAVWAAEEHNARVAARAATSLDDASRAADRVNPDPDYLQGFAAGVEALRRRHLPDCDRLEALSFSSVATSVPGDRKGDDPADRAWKQGFQDGQELVFGLMVARRIGGCAVPVPPLP